MGDTVLTTPALALLKAARPDLRIYVVLEPPWRPLLDGNPDVTGVVEMEAGSSRLRTIAAIRRLRPALCLNLHGGSTSAWLAALSGARWRAGFAHFRHRWSQNVHIPRAQEILGRAADAPVHTAEHLASALFHLGVPPAEIPRARLFAEPDARPRPYAVVHTGAAYFTKQWAPERVAALAAWLRESQGLEPVILRGPADCSLAEMMSLLAGAELFVGNDSGPAHVAAAFGVPVVVIFGSSDSRVWGPWRTPHRVVETAWDCKPCPGDRCYAFDRPRCILSVETEEVQRAVTSLLGARAAVRA
jgi:ADP-heptose:LPS heptosyltransferase